MKWLLLTLLIPGSSYALPSQWRLFYLQTISQESVFLGVKKIESSCTGTLIKLENTCHLITSAHCFKKNSDYAFVFSGGNHFPEYSYDLRTENRSKTSAYDLFETGETKVSLTPLHKHFISKDLAELKLPKELSPICEQLAPLKPSLATSGTFAAAGFYMSGGMVSFTKDTPWVRGEGKVTLKKISTSLNLNLFFEVPELTSYRGMSGGIVFDKSKNPVGIVTRNIPYRQKTFIIGMDEVSSFLKESKEPQPSHPEIFFEGNHLISTTNSSKNVGENEHGNGGENDHANGEDDGKKGRAPELSLFRTPREGVIDPFNREHVILSKCQEQIDGFDDYVRLKDCQQDIITRPKGEAPTEEVRFGILKRMFSNLDQKILKGDASTPYFFASSQILDQWQKLTQGEAKITARVTGASLYIHSKGQKMIWLWNGEQIKGGGDRAFQFFFFKGPDAKTIHAVMEYAKEEPRLKGGTTYTLTHKELVCSNMNYLKLICSDKEGEVEFSLSKKHIHSPGLEFQLALRTGINLANMKGFEVILTNYGEIKVDEAGRLSDLPNGHPILLGL